MKMQDFVYVGDEKYFKLLTQIIHISTVRSGIVSFPQYLSRYFEDPYGSRQAEENVRPNLADLFITV